MIFFPFVHLDYFYLHVNVFFVYDPITYDVRRGLSVYERLVFLLLFIFNKKNWKLESFWNFFFFPVIYRIKNWKEFEESRTIKKFLFSILWNEIIINFTVTVL